MNNRLGGSLLCALFASISFGAADTRAAGLSLGSSNVAKSEKLLASPVAVSRAALKEIGEASDSLRIWLDEVLAAAGALTLAAMAVLTFRRKRRVRNHRLQTLYELPEMPTAPGERRTPRRLPTNPYLDSDGPAAISRQIENAAEASLEFGRVLGLIYFDLGAPPKGDSPDEARDGDADHRELLAKLKLALRSTDHVALLSDHEIVACIALLPGRTELVGIAERLRKIGQSSTRFARAFAPDAGLAIYPVCGYRGEDLIDHARADFHSRKPPVTAFLLLSGPILEDVSYPKA